MSGGEVGEAWYNILDNVSKIIFYYFCYIGPLRDIFKYLNYLKDVTLIFRSLKNWWGLLKNYISGSDIPTNKCGLGVPTL